jgi:hypothetical protein
MIGLSATKVNSSNSKNNQIVDDGGEFTRENKKVDLRGTVSPGASGGEI